MDACIHKYTVTQFAKEYIIVDADMWPLSFIYVCMCVCACMHTYIHTYIHTCIYIHTFIPFAEDHIIVKDVTEAEYFAIFIHWYIHTHTHTNTYIRIFTQFAEDYIIVKDMTEAEYVANYIVNGGNVRFLHLAFFPHLSPYTYSLEYYMVKHKRMRSKCQRGFFSIFVCANDFMTYKGSSLRNRSVCLHP